MSLPCLTAPIRMAAGEGATSFELAAIVWQQSLLMRLTNRVQAALYALHEGNSCLEEEIEPDKGDCRSTLLDPFGISSDTHLMIIHHLLTGSATRDG